MTNDAMSKECSMDDGAWWAKRQPDDVDANPMVCGLNWVERTLNIGHWELNIEHSLRHVSQHGIVR